MGQGLLNLSIIKKLAHQVIILESLGYLHNFHYNLDREDTQCVIVCLWISCKARYLYTEMVMYPPKVEEKHLITATVILNVVEVLDKKLFDRQVGQVLDDGNVKLVMLMIKLWVTITLRDAPTVRFFLASLLNHSEIYRK